MNGFDKTDMPKETYDMISQIIKFIDKNDKILEKERKIGYED